jgi:hypothetical protein
LALVPLQLAPQLLPAVLARLYLPVLPLSVRRQHLPAWL